MKNTILAIIILILLATSVNAEIIAKSKAIEIDKNENKQIAIVQITLDKPGQNLVYIERYYVIDNNKNLTIKVGKIYYNNTVENKTLNLKVKRPLADDGKPYPVIRAIAIVDNETKLNAFYRYPKTSSEGEASDKATTPGFEGIEGIIAVSLIIILFARRNR